MTVTTRDPTRSAAIPTDRIWAIEPGRLEAMRNSLTPEAVQGAMGTLRTRRPSLPMRREGRVAVVEISGPMTKHPTIFSALFGGTSTLEAREAVLEAAGDEDVEAILVEIDSPGGSVDGLAELGDAIYAARNAKPVVAQVTGICASGAFYAASQAHRIFAQRQDMVGSIGVRLLLYDFSAAFDKAGVEAVPITTGAFKAAGAYGTKITDEQRDYFQGVIDAYGKDFVRVVARGRDMSTAAVEKVADGRIHPAADAVYLGLIDGIQTIEKTLSQLQHGKPKATQKARKAMTTAESAKRYEDLIEEKTDAGMSRSAARSQVGEEHPKLLDAYIAHANRHRHQAEANKHGASEFGALVSTKMRAGMSRADATRQAATERPELKRAHDAHDVHHCA